MVAVAAWVLVVAVGSTLVWAVISRAGEGVVSGSGDVTTLGVPQPGQPTPGAPSNRPRHPSPTPTAPAGPASQAPSTATPPAPPLPAPSSAAPSSTSATPAPQQAPAQRRTWQGRPGVVVAECRGSSIRLVGAYPNSGWSVQVEERGPQRLAVRFEGNDDQGETGLGARCVQGAPAYDASGDG